MDGEAKGRQGDRHETVLVRPLLYNVVQELVALSAQNKELCSKLSVRKRYFVIIF